MQLVSGTRFIASKMHTLPVPDAETAADDRLQHLKESMPLLIGLLPESYAKGVAGQGK